MYLKKVETEPFDRASRVINYDDRKKEAVHGSKPNGVERESGRKNYKKP
jgi:hypothetical protein